MERRIVLGVSGSVAAYRAADLARELMRRGFVVRVCLTDSAEKFVTRALFEALTGQPCLVDAFEEPVTGRMAHIDWAREAEAVVLAPATANTLAKVAHGIADDMLSTIATAFNGPLIIAPAMNPSMYAHEPTQAAIRTLQQQGAQFVEPVVGDVACGENGQGKFADVVRIADAIVDDLARGTLLKGKRVLITSGPTQEPIDIARYVTNRSSGKMGAALARAATHLGAASVTVVSGPVSVIYAPPANVLGVRTAEEMLAAALPLAAQADIIIGAAAVADYRPAEPSTGKIRRQEGDLSLRLVPNPDIIAELAKAAPQAMVVGFAAEPSPDPAAAVAKLQRKGLAAIALNDVSAPGQGFGTDTNRLRLLMADGTDTESELLSKMGCSLWLYQQLSAR
ncbi:MAG: bifunctional phosphopantothenoylcysteine decarboxylase/phosphopantothenate--cysteine ligase CoaBC [Chthonomonas sp.]|nr:bifunctional phosphopantothenoylcysteine decarboxylase/phosphopantothenate--cysteine ligase CoaBC [Chthonomonas sp.]